MHPISHLFLMIVKPYYHVSLPFLFLMCLYPSFFRRQYYIRNGSKLWLRRWVLFSPVRLGNWCPLLLIFSLLVVVEYLWWSIDPMKYLIGIRPAWLLEVLLRHTEWAIWKLFLLSLISVLSLFYSLWLLISSSRCFNWMWRTPSCVVTSMRRSIWSNHLGILLKGRLWCVNSRKRYMTWRMSTCVIWEIQLCCQHRWFSTMSLWSLSVHLSQFN